MRYNAEFNKRIPVTGLGGFLLIVANGGEFISKMQFLLTFHATFTATSVNAIDTEVIKQTDLRLWMPHFGNTLYAQCLFF